MEGDSDNDIFITRNSFTSSLEYDTDILNAAVHLHSDHSCLNYANNVSNKNKSKYEFLSQDTSRKQMLTITIEAENRM